jgi:hypothetical protein
MYKRNSIGAFVVLALELMAFGAAAEVLITRRDGTVLRLDIAPEDIKSIIFGASQGPRDASDGPPRSLPDPGRRDGNARGADASGSPSSRTGQIIRVGPQLAVKWPSEAARIARDGDVVEIQAGTYEGDAAVWRQNRLVIRSVGGRAHLKAGGINAEGKGIWVIKGNDVTVEGVEFSEARVPDGNGAGIRQEGANLTIRDCYFHHNENGLLSGGSPASRILIENSEFAYNGSASGRTHNIYVGDVRSFVLRYSYVHHAHIGHNVKSRARMNHILYNRIGDEKDGDSSYLVDLSSGGRAVILGNILQQGRRTENSTLVSLGAEGNAAGDRFDLVNNTMINERVEGGVFVRNISPGAANLVNNILAGNGEALVGVGTMQANLISSSVASSGSLAARPVDTFVVRGLRNYRAAFAGFSDPATYDYRLAPASPAIDLGIDPETLEPSGPKPVEQYVHRASKEPREPRGQIDIGAYEFSGGDASRRRASDGQ